MFLDKVAKSFSIEPKIDVVNDYILLKKYVLEFEKIFDSVKRLIAYPYMRELLEKNIKL